MSKTKIDWADEVWNPVTGCTPISEGCEHCYAKRMSNRLRGRFGYPAADPFRPGTVHQNILSNPPAGKSRRIFVGSMGDLFHEDVSNTAISMVFRACNDQYQHEWMFLTKRPTAMKVFLSLNSSPYFCHWWFGVSVELQKYDCRVDDLCRIHDACRFVSVEPMLGPVSLKANLNRLDMVIIGTETGPGARECRREWVDALVAECNAAGVRVHLKENLKRAVG